MMTHQAKMPCRHHAWIFQSVDDSTRSWGTVHQNPTKRCAAIDEIATIVGSTDLLELQLLQQEEEELEDLMDNNENASGHEDIAKEKGKVAPNSNSPAKSPPKIASIFLKPLPKSEVKPPASTVLNGPAKAKAAACQQQLAGANDINEEEEEEEGDEEEEVGARPEKRSKIGSKAKSSTHVEGVGQGALAAAAKHATVDIQAVIGGRWAAGEPVPFEFLADTFEAIAETSKRLDIVNLLVRRRGRDHRLLMLSPSGLSVSIKRFPSFFTMQINCFRAIITTTPDDLLPAMYLCTNRCGKSARILMINRMPDHSSIFLARVAPAHFGIEMGIGEGTLFKVMRFQGDSI